MMSDMSMNTVRSVTCFRQRGTGFALLLLIALTLHQLAMLSPMHEHSMPMVFSATTHSDTAQTAGSMPAHEQPAIGECPAIVAVMFDLSGLLFLLLLCLRRTLTTIAVVTTRRVAVVHWLWPPDKRRALLQVFLC